MAIDPLYLHVCQITLPPSQKKVRYPLDGVFYECRKRHYFSNSRAYNFSLIISLINKYDQYGNAKTTSIRYLRCQKNANKRFTFTDIILTMMTMNWLLNRLNINSHETKNENKEKKVLLFNNHFHKHDFVSYISDGWERLAASIHLKGIVYWFCGYMWWLFHCPSHLPPPEYIEKL